MKKRIILTESQFIRIIKSSINEQKKSVELNDIESVKTLKNLFDKKIYQDHGSWRLDGSNIILMSKPHPMRRLDNEERELIVIQKPNEVVGNQGKWKLDLKGPLPKILVSL